MNRSTPLRKINGAATDYDDPVVVRPERPHHFGYAFSLIIGSFAVQPLTGDSRWALSNNVSRTPGQRRKNRDCIFPNPPGRENHLTGGCGDYAPCPVASRRRTRAQAGRKELLL